MTEPLTAHIPLPPIEVHPNDIYFNRTTDGRWELCATNLNGAPPMTRPHSAHVLGVLGGLLGYELDWAMDEYRKRIAVARKLHGMD